MRARKQAAWVWPILIAFVVIFLFPALSGFDSYSRPIHAAPGDPCNDDRDCNAATGETCVDNKCQLPMGGGPPPPPTGGGTTGGQLDLPNPLTATTIADVLNNIINFLLVVAVPVAIIMTIWAGYLFMTGGGSEEKVATARKTLLYVVIGVAVLILSKGLISLVVSIVK